MKDEIQVISNALTSVSGYMTQNRRGKKIAEIKEALINLSKSVTTVLVCGEFKRGKSTFVNALIGRNVCPTDTDICTSVVSIIKYGEKPKATRSYGDFSNIKSQVIDFEDIERYTVGSAEEIDNTLFIEIELPLNALKQGLVLIDTPGVGGLDPRHATLTNYFLPQADVTLFMTDVNEPLTTTELDFYKNKVLQYAKHSAVIVNKADLKDDKSVEEIRQDTIQKVSVYTQTPPQDLNIISVSSVECIREEDGHGNFDNLRKLISKLVQDHKRTQLGCIRDNLSEQLEFAITPLQAQISQIERPNVDQVKELSQQKDKIDNQLKELSDPNSEFRLTIIENVSDEREAIINFLNEETILFSSETFNKLMSDERAKGEKGGSWLGQQINDQMEALGSEVTLKLNKAFERIAAMEEFEGFLNFKAKNFSGRIVVKDVNLSVPIHKRIMPLTSSLGVMALSGMLLTGIPLVGWLAPLGLGAFVAYKNQKETTTTYKESNLRQVYQPQLTAATQNLRAYVENRFAEFQREWLKVISERAKDYRDSLKTAIEEIQTLKQKISSAVNNEAKLKNALQPLQKAKDAIDALHF